MKLRMLALATVAAAALSTPALAGEGWYLGLGGGYDSPQKITATSTVAPITSTSFTPNSGGIGVISFGYGWGDGWRVEDEIGYSASSSTVGTNSGNGQVIADMVNAIYDIPLGSNFKLSLGGGVGIGDARLKINTIPPSALNVIKDDQIGFEWQAIAGISYALSSDVDLFAEYRFRSNETNATFGGNTAPGANPQNINRVQENVAMAGLRWFPWSQPAAPMMAPPPPPPPPPPPAKTYIVFFDFDKSNLTAEAESTVTEAVAAAKSLGHVRIMVTGHTDTVGSDHYNQALSVRRATTVKDEMVRQGLGADAIGIEGKSFHDPLVPTGPGVREPKNRRAVIDLGG